MKTADIAMYKTFVADATEMREDFKNAFSLRLFSKYSQHLERAMKMQSELMERADQLGILSVHENRLDVIQVHLDGDIFHAFQFGNITEEKTGDFIHLYALVDDISFTTCFEINEKN